jgi:pyruvate/2-oxoglutarate dehydrogenase complex dihydrolipoamide acyltransferase (E2) component
MRKIKLTGLRATIGEFVRVSSRCNPIFVVADIDATALKAFCAAQGCSVTAALIKIIAGLADRHPLMNAVLARSLTLRRYLYLCDDVDMAVSVEKVDGETRFVTTPIMRQVNRKSLAEVSAELAVFSAQPFHERPDYRLLWLFNLLPGFLKYCIMIGICQSHVLFRQFFGTIGLSGLGNLGPSYVYPLWPNAVVFGIGTIAPKPVVRGGMVTAAPVLPVTLGFNHCVLDGWDAGRILADLRTVIETGDLQSICRCL